MNRKYLALAATIGVYCAIFLIGGAMYDNVL